MNESEVRAIVRDELRLLRGLGGTEAKASAAATRPLDKDPALFSTFFSQITDALTDRRLEAFGLLERNGLMALPSMFLPFDAKRVAARLDATMLGAHLPPSAWSPLVAEATEAKRTEAARLARVRAEASQRSRAADEAEAKAFQQREATRVARNQGPNL